MSEEKQRGIAQETDDVRLVERARGGDLEAFEALLARHQQRVLRVAF